MIPICLAPQGAEFQTVLRKFHRSGMEVIAIPLGQRSGDFLRKLVLDVHRPVILWGLCGSLSHQFPIGSVVVCRECKVENRGFPCDLGLTDQLATTLDCPIVNCYTADRVVHQSHTKITLGVQYGCEVVDMEGYHVLEALKEKGNAVGMVRVVSDGLEGDLPNVSAMIDSKGNLSYGALAGCLFSHPIGTVRLIYGGLMGLSSLGASTARWVSRA